MSETFFVNEIMDCKTQSMGILNVLSLLKQLEIKLDLFPYRQGAEENLFYVTLHVQYL